MVSLAVFGVAEPVLLKIRGKEIETITGALELSIVTLGRRVSKGEYIWMVLRGGIINLIIVFSAPAFAVTIAVRSEPTPESQVLVT